MYGATVEEAKPLLASSKLSYRDDYKYVTSRDADWTRQSRAGSCAGVLERGTRTSAASRQRRTSPRAQDMETPQRRAVTRTDRPSKTTELTTIYAKTAPTPPTGRVHDVSTHAVHYLMNSHIQRHPRYQGCTSASVIDNSSTLTHQALR